MFCVSITYVDEGIKFFTCKTMREAYKTFRTEIERGDSMMGYILDGDTGELLVFSHYSSTQENGVGAYSYHANRLVEILKQED